MPTASAAAPNPMEPILGLLRQQRDALAQQVNELHLSLALSEQKCAGLEQRLTDLEKLTATKPVK